MHFISMLMNINDKDFTRSKHFFEPSQMKRTISARRALASNLEQASSRGGVISTDDLLRLNVFLCCNCLLKFPILDDPQAYGL